MPMKQSAADNGRRTVMFLICGWVVIAWTSADFYFSHFATKLYQEESQLADQQVRNVANNIDDSLQQLKGIPVVFSRDEDTRRALRQVLDAPEINRLAYAERKEVWTKDKMLDSLNESLRVAAANLVADVLWVIDPQGNCIAASNSDMAESFVGMNYADRDYFQQAKAGYNGRQYAVGRASRIPGMFYSSPVFEQGVFLGAVVAKRNIESFAKWVNQADAFLSDANGVIILAPEKELEFRALPHAAALKLSPTMIQAQYKQEELSSIELNSWGDERFPSAVRIEKQRLPVLLASQSLVEDALNVYVRRPLGELVRLSTERMWFFFLLASLGGLLIYAASVVFFYLRQLQKTEAALRISATAFESQEGMMITDAAGVILKVNRAFTESTGYTSAEAVGRRSNLLKSSHHDDAFFAVMWEKIRQTGAWTGEIWNRRKDGSEHPDWMTVTAVKGVNGEITHYVASQTDISQRKAAEQEIEQLAFYDPLTQLPNRRLLMDRLQRALANSARSCREGALLFIDLDNFKSLNDTLGHDKGDLLLQQVAKRLAGCLREGDTVARFGGDEFVVMLENLSADTQETIKLIETVGEKILGALNENFMLDSHEHRSTPSIGVALFSNQQHSPDELLKRADLAMYESKAAGRNTLRFYDPEMQAVVATRVALEGDLRRALAEKQLLVYYQAQVDAAGQVVGAEALVRWQHPTRGLVPPIEFIGLAEETGLILPLGSWVLETACQQLNRWSAHMSTAGLTLAVNVSAQQFRRVDFVEQVLDTLARTQADPRKLKLELTESLLLEDVEDIIAKMTTLKQRGVGFALDDFGTGYSSLSYLKRLPLDQLKIDKSFVRDIVHDSSDAAICTATIDLARNLQFNVVAEGVETEEQQIFLGNAGCDFMQGYLFCKPLPLCEFESLVGTDFAYCTPPAPEEIGRYPHAMHRLTGKPAPRASMAATEHGHATQVPADFTNINVPRQLDTAAV